MRIGNCVTRGLTQGPTRESDTMVVEHRRAYQSLPRILERWTHLSVISSRFHLMTDKHNSVPTR